ncbi:MAG: flagellar biosynthesis anti-sigma factor FlgM [Thermodesulfovibrionales bacterium]|nr:flagellar biosynthesis anti-sigma factor FlgM [Thermodesulfovibrionales bacterium]
MKIYNNKNPQLQDLSQNVQRINKIESKDASQTSKRISPTDKVDISNRAKEIAELMSAINQMPDIRSEKVAEIKKAIEDGTYVIDPKRIAESILREVL